MEITVPSHQKFFDGMSYPHAYWGNEQLVFTPAGRGATHFDEDTIRECYVTNETSIQRNIHISGPSSGKYEVIYSPLDRPNIRLITYPKSDVVTLRILDNRHSYASKHAQLKADYDKTKGGLLGVHLQLTDGVDVVQGVISPTQENDEQLRRWLSHSDNQKHYSVPPQQKLIVRSRQNGTHTQAVHFGNPPHYSFQTEHFAMYVYQPKPHHTGFIVDYGSSSVTANIPTYLPPHICASITDESIAHYWAHNGDYFNNTSLELNSNYSLT